MNELLRVLIVDDEPLARAGLRDLLDRDARVAVVGEADNGRAALAAVDMLRPDLILLDVRMPGIGGIELATVLRQRRAPDSPAIIFVTAFDAHALAAFEVDATDYVVKPVNPDRLARAIDRVLLRRQLASDAEAGRRVAATLEEWHGARAASERPSSLERITVTAGRRSTIVSVADIDWIEARSYYARLHVGATTHLLRQSMDQLERQLDPSRFARIHRSTIVQLDRVASLEPRDRRSFVVRLRDGRTLLMSRRRRRLLDFLFP